MTLGFLVAKHDRRHGCSRRWPSLDRLSRVLFSGAPSVCPSTGVPFAIVPRPWFRMILVQRRMRSERGGGRGPKFVSRFLKPVRLGRLRTPVRVQARVSMYVHACHVARASLSAALVSVHHDHTNALKTPLHSGHTHTTSKPPAAPARAHGHRPVPRRFILNQVWGGQTGLLWRDARSGGVRVSYAFGARRAWHDDGHRMSGGGSCRSVAGVAYGHVAAALLISCPKHFA